ncbi:NAD(P)/FAD-dependent oxidoreductase [Humitalea sp. 24SJ18S-53]|uniref:NAD(P)/FAD-dependent oxidoreductase n=1 Tax=Humitalea sp. 24SJ18S-53 TaxID=3422307 RepID=UPI003D67D524
MSPALEAIESDGALPAQADVVVIGGGIIGVMAAYVLAQRGVSVALVEKGRVGAEQSSRNWGWCRQQGRDPAEIPLSQHSLRLWGSLQEEIGRDLGFRRSGVTFVTKDPAQVAEWEGWLAQARPFGLDSRLLGGAETDALLRGSSETWLAGLHTPSDGVAEPSLAAPRIAQAARGLGASLHQGCAARGLETTAGAVSAVVTEAGRIRTSRVLCAGGAWTSMFCRHHGIPLPQAGVYATAFRTVPGPDITAGGIGMPGFAVRRRADGSYTVGLAGRGRVEISPQGLLYAREFWPTFQKRRRNVTLGLGRSFFSGPEAMRRWSLDGISPFERLRVLDPAPSQALVETALAQIRAAYPGWGDVAAAEAWGGFIDSTPDAVPVISAVATLPGMYLATGFSGHGFGIAPGAGYLAADLMMGLPPIVDPAGFRYARLVEGGSLAPRGSF